MRLMLFEANYRVWRKPGKRPPQPAISQMDAFDITVQKLPLLSPAPLVGHHLSRNGTRRPEPFVSGWKATTTPVMLFASIQKQSMVSE
jgi:hypothetical protein